VNPAFRGWCRPGLAHPVSRPTPASVSLVRHGTAGRLRSLHHRRQCPRSILRGPSRRYSVLGPRRAAGGGIRIVVSRVAWRVLGSVLCVEAMRSSLRRSAGGTSANAEPVNNRSCPAITGPSSAAYHFTRKSRQLSIPGRAIGSCGGLVTTKSSAATCRGRQSKDDEISTGWCLASCLDTKKNHQQSAS
jgi:hypothetical protein